MALRRVRDRARIEDDEVGTKVERELDDADKAAAKRRARGEKKRRPKRTERDKLDATPPWETRRTVEVDATTGPWDAADEPDDDLERVDLGAMKIPVADGLDVRVDVDPSGATLMALLVHPAGHMQLGVFAAPRSEGIWDEVRDEIRGSIGAQRGTVQEVDGPFGTELTGSIPGDGGQAKVRFVGVDGPRWFLRAMLVGAPATDPSLAETFEEIIRGVVVVRGTEPAPVRDPIPLTLPPELADQVAAAAAEAES